MLTGESKQTLDGPSDLFGPGGVLIQLAAGLSDGIWMIAGDDTTLYANKAMADLLGCEPEVLIGKSVTQFIPQEQVQTIRDAAVQSGSETRVTELALHRADGKAIWARLNVLMWQEGVGGDGGLIAVVQNITDRRAADETHALLAAIIRSSDDAIVSKTLEGIVTSWNPGATEVFGYTADEMIGESIKKIIPLDRHPEEDDFLARLRRGEQISHFETVRVRKDGTPIDISVTISPIRDSNGVIVGASKVARNITDQRRSERISGHLAAIVQSTGDAVVSKDLNGIVQSWNQGAQMLFGYTPEEMIGQPILRLLPKDRLSEEDHILSKVRKGERVEPFETIRVAKDGRLLDVSVTVSPIFSSTGEIIGASKIARDIGPQKAVERSLRESEEALRQLAATLEVRVRERTAELEAAVREMEGFTYTVSHDLRGPLRAIIACCRLLQDDYSAHIPPDANRLLERQIAAAGKMAQLIDDLLRLSRLGRQELHVKDVDLSKLAEEVTAEISGQAAEPPEVVIQPGMRARADEMLLRLAIQNLLENSVKFAKPGERAQIEIGQSDDCFFVRDHGIGFEGQYARKIFVPFERLHRDVDYPGTGIGLANVRRIVERHHGHVWAEGRPGDGSTFYFTLSSAK